MRYLNTHNIVSAYQNNAKTTKNKFWGLLALLSGVGQKVQPGVNYYFNQQFVGSVLDRLFLLDGQKKSLSIGKLTSNVIFSTHWIEVVKTDMVVGKPNIYDVATWYFRNEEFEEGITAKGLVTRFIDELYLSEDFVNTIFSLTEERQIIFERHQASDQDILSKLNLQTSTGSITAESSTIAAFPRELSRAPFFQTLYSSQSILAGVIITNFDFAEYYLVSQSQAQVLPKNYNGDKGQLLQLYKYFITNCTLKAKSITNYTDFKRINECIAQLGLDGYKELLDFDNPVALENAIEKLKEQPLYIDYNKRGNNQYSATIGTYLQFLYALQLSGIDKVSPSPSLPPLDPSQCTKYIDFLIALRTKPFLLLAGISGTGKSRIVKEMAFASCPDVAELRNDPVSPGNYLLVEVKPNWHDSTELLGYESTIKKGYVLTPFVKFLYKAMKHPDVPFFVCLDEMNLAPVEQYFAEYLSILESRKQQADGTILTEPLIRADIFKKYPKLYEELNGKAKELDVEKSYRTVDFVVEYTPSNYGKEYEMLCEEGLRIPQNVVVIGTVNMDETTHQFSRKVIDRAMTIEMNEVKFDGFFESSNELSYADSVLPKEYFLPCYTTAGKALESVPDDAEHIKANVPALLEQLNEALADTPFKIAYRVQNELVLYFAALRQEEAHKATGTAELLATAMDQILMMKVLPRIEGDDELLEKPLERLAVYAEGYPKASAKIKEMQERLGRSHFTSFWP